MLLWQGAKRAVSVRTAAEIAAEAVQHGVQPVAVFVDEDADTIVRVCSETGISTAQLHGDGARAALSDIPPELQVDAAAGFGPTAVRPVHYLHVNDIHIHHLHTSCLSAGDLRPARDNRRRDSDRAADSKQKVTDIAAARCWVAWLCTCFGL
jgi:N-(5'phosphoribosyl)anthranilate (PRA) isomerase